jgi:hypothetical protein
VNNSPFLSNPSLLPNPMQAKYMFPSAYGGFVASESPPQIHDMMRALRIEVGAVEAKKSEDKFGPKFPVRGAKDLAQKLANALNSLNMEAPVIAQEVTLLEADKVPANERPNGNPVFRTLAHVKATVRIIAPDTSFIDVVGSGHGGDVDDKSGGKASTYAWKDALLKGLSIPHEDMVDTDDDSSTGESAPSKGRGGRVASKEAGSKDAAGQRGSRGESKGAASARSEPVGPAVGSVAGDDVAEVDPKGVAYVLTKIAEANSKADLEQIRAAITSGVLTLEGSDRLKATTAYMARMKELS